MTSEEKIDYWVDLSDYDLESAEVMLFGKRYLYVGFLCHQAIEKILKGCYTKLKEETPPFTHDLPYLAVKGDFYELFSQAQKEFMDEIEPLNIKTRYPDYKKEVVKKLTYERCVTLLEQTKILQQWIKKTIL
jgi:HEPN domain-containing protein